jgi:hypothetical protein
MYIYCVFVGLNNNLDKLNFPHIPLSSVVVPPSFPKSKGAQISDVTSLGRIHFVRWTLILVVSQHGTRFPPLFSRLEFWGIFRTFGTLLDPRFSLVVVLLTAGMHLYTNLEMRVSFMCNECCVHLHQTQLFIIIIYIYKILLSHINMFYHHTLYNRSTFVN